MTGTTVARVDAGQVDGDAPPAGTAIVRPLRHVQAVRERHVRQLAQRAQTAESRSARAWSWALGETVIAPVTDRVTAAPASRSDIEAEIAEADERRLRGDRENRADSAATILRWLIGEDDRVPVRSENRGALVGGFGDVVRSPAQMAAVLAAAHDRSQAVTIRAASSDSHGRPSDADYLDGVIATLMWVLGEQLDAPITSKRSRQLTSRDLKVERVHAQDVEQGGQPWLAQTVPSPRYGEGVKLTITWLLGESTMLPL